MSSKSSKNNKHHSSKMFLNGKADSAVYVEASKDLDKKKNAAPSPRISSLRRI